MAATICGTYSHFNKQSTLFYSCNDHEKNRCDSFSNVGKLADWFDPILGDGLVICIIGFCSFIDRLNHLIDFLDSLINLLKTEILQLLTTLVAYLNEKPTSEGGSFDDPSGCNLGFYFQRIKAPENTFIPKLIFNSKELIIFCNPVGSRHRPCFDLTCIGGNC
jgi:hypothetical protein